MLGYFPRSIANSKKIRLCIFFILFHPISVMFFVSPFTRYTKPMGLYSVMSCCRADIMETLIGRIQEKKYTKTNIFRIDNGTGKATEHV